MKIIKGSCATILGLVAVSTTAAAESARAATQVQEADRTARTEEIVVTATRREQNLQDVPISVSAVSEYRLVQANITEPTQLGAVVPGLVMTTRAGGLNPAIRGVGNTDVAAGFESSIALYIDGVYRPAPFGTILPINNVERIEVLKGPQGTLFGRNSAGGLIHIVTKTPSHNTSVSGSASYGNYETARANFYATTGITEDLAVDIAAAYVHQGKGYGRNLVTGNDVNKTKSLLLRSKLLFTPGDATKIVASLEYVHANDDRGLARQFLPGAVGPDRVTTYTGNFYDIVNTVDPGIKTEGYTASIQIEHEFSALTFKSISAFQKSSAVNQFDNDVVPAPIVNVLYDDNSFKTITQEVQLLSPSDSKVKWIVGAFYMDDDAGNGGTWGRGLFGSAFAGVCPSRVCGTGLLSNISTRSISGFGEVTLPLGNKTDLTAGARYTSDRRRVSGSNLVLEGKTLDANFLNTEEWNVISNTPFPTESKTYDELTYRGIVNHRFTDDVMAYVSYSRGFKSGNFNLTVPAQDPFKPETIDAYELGIKTELFDRRLRFNGALYHYDYKDIQLGVSVGNTLMILNATSAKSTGFEFEGNASFTDQLSLDFSFNYLHSKLGSFPNAICIFRRPVGGQQVTCDATGKRPPYAPKVTASMTPTFVTDVAGGSLTVTGTWAYNGGFFWDFPNILKEKAYSLFSASIGWEASSKRYGIRLFGSNLTDKHYSLWTIPRTGGDTYTPAPPRTYGVELSFNF